jgi:hypothetical protein
MAKESRARHLRIRLSSPLRRRKVWHQTAGHGNEAGRPGFAKFEARVAVFRIVEAGGIEQGAAAAATAAPADSLPILAPAAGGFLLAGFVKGVIGLGMPTVAIGLLGLLITPAQAAAILLGPSLATNIWQFVVGGDLLGAHLALRGLL